MQSHVRGHLVQQFYPCAMQFIGNIQSQCLLIGPHVLFLCKTEDFIQIIIMLYNIFSGLSVSEHTAPPLLLQLYPDQDTIGNKKGVYKIQV